ncbi:uncharacterized protein BO97DRAFT_267995 [Aspergillus homomorphus CBS 101889]|uniref:Uncharacterized protein n=1 Tax=Aspergillus homomorphus (strain CBS 101889) TaxID=1450537 RepID=A0A395HGN6_ASPHC|nr:hypothetical protein BO97DRAFT_267995 [Aspergillus homomorphus CBS 101889]RAL07072.1 hypothetical protein BO97DRAFT_267995 [Aspergillus homomorphus CBS 101889]
MRTYPSSKLRRASLPLELIANILTYVINHSYLHSPPSEPGRDKRNRVQHRRTSSSSHQGSDPGQKKGAKVAKDKRETRSGSSSLS